MTLPRSYIDGFLIAWEAGEYEAQVKSMRQVSQALVPVVRLHGAGGGKGGEGLGAPAKRAEAIRDRLARTVRKTPEVMVKITSSSKGMRQIGRHLDYISRKGQIDIEDQDGAILRGREELTDVKDVWRYGGPEEIGEVSDRRDTLNIVFSMPAQTDEVSLRRAVRAFAAQEFDGHQYVFAYHTQATDPDPSPPAHPHVHLSVKVDGQDGRRLNPRKADLQRWREGFAEQLRVHGIEANATSRLARLRLDRGTKRSVLAVMARGEALLGSGQVESDTSRAQRARDLEADRVAYYQLLHDTLTQSEAPSDHVLAADVRRYVLQNDLEKIQNELKPAERGPSSGRDR